MTILWISTQLVAGLLLALLAFWICTKMFDLVYPRIRVIQRDRLVLHTKAALAQAKIRQANIHPIYPSDAGRMPLLIGNDPDIRVRDPLTMRTYDLLGGMLEIQPTIEQAEQMVRLAQALPQGERIQDLMDQAQIPQAWPQTPQLVDVMRSRQPSLLSLVLGQLESGELVVRSIHSMMHTLVVASTDHGKSAWIQSLLYQVALAPERIEVIAVDIHGSAFNVLADWNKLRFPVAKTRGEAQDVFNATARELSRRKQLYMMHPTATSLIEYNRVAEVPLAPWLVLVDEGTILMNESGMQAPIRALVQGGRQYGFYAIVTGQSAHYKVMETQIRDQFRTRWVGWTSAHSARAVLGTGDLPGDMPVQKGRAWVQLDNGRSTQLMQGLYISPEQLLQAIQTGGPAQPFPEVEASLSEAAEVRRLSGQGLEPAEILKRVRGRRPNGRDYKALQNALCT